MDFNGLVSRISPKLRGIVYRLRMHAACISHDDLYQESLLHLWKAYGSGSLDNKTDSYILQGCYFFLKNYLRMHTARVPVNSLEEVLHTGDAEVRLEDILAAGRDDTAPLKDSLHTKLFAETLLNNGFTPREKAVMRLCADGLTVRQIGKELGISHVMVVKLLGRIRAGSRKYVDFT